MVKYHSDSFDVLTFSGNPGSRQCLVGSLTGAVSSQRVTEEHEGWLITVGHREVSAMAKASLTARLTSRADAKAGHSDPVVPYGSPGAAVGPKGMAVRHLKWYASWVQNVVRQFGPYLPWALDD